MNQQHLFISLALSLTLSLTASFATAQTLSVKDWEEQLENSVIEEDSRTFSDLLNFSRLESTYLKRKVGEDRVALLNARRLYESKKFSEAIGWYDKVPKGSDFWLEAVEEKGWAYLKLDQPDKALAQTKTLLAPPFVNVVGSEPFFLQSLTQLGVCDYKGIFATHKLFKETNRDRIVAIQGIVDTDSSSALLALTKRVDRFPLSLDQVRSDTKVLPRLFFRDAELQKNIMLARLSSSALRILQNTDVENPAMRSLIDRMRIQLERNQKAALPQIQARIKKLAQAETAENAKMLQKFNLIEVDAIQRVHIDQKLNPDQYARNEFKKTGSDDLVFADDGRPWLDELDKYQYEVSSCPKNLRRRM